MSLQQIQNLFLYIAAVCGQLWLGISVFVSFALAPVLFFNFPVELAADVLSKVFPVYGKIMSILVFLILFGLLFSWKNKAKCGSIVYKIFIIVLVMANILNTLQAFYIFPLTRTLREIVKSGRAAGNLDSIAPQAQELMRWHSISVGINNILIVLAMATTWLFFRIIRNMNGSESKKYG